jgi:hypothetical protein
MKGREEKQTAEKKRTKKQGRLKNLNQYKKSFELHKQQKRFEKDCADAINRFFKRSVR